jgi:hypothetical protein
MEIMSSSNAKLIPVRYVDRTRTAVDWKCPRQRFWNYEYANRGIVKTGTSLELFLGICVHDALAAIGSLQSRGFDIDIDTIAETAYLQVYNQLVTDSTPEAIEFGKEQGTLVEGLVRGFFKHVWPALMSEYKVVCAEKEMEYSLGEGFVFMAKPDLIVEDKDGELTYLEYKTTSSKKEQWINSWDTAVQLHSSVLATEQTLGKRPTYVRIIGLYKGYESYGKQGSPMCYGYKKFGNPPFTQDQIQYEFKAGFRRTPVWEMKGGIKEWVETMPMNVLADQFPMTMPIFVNEDLVKSFFRQRLEREKEIAAYDPENIVLNLDKVFPQNFDACQPAWGYGCGYKKLCHGYVENPLDAGFELRTPHHIQEAELLGLTHD